MFRITQDPSSGSLVQCLAKNYKNDSIVCVDMDKVGVMAAYSDLSCVCVVHCIWSHFIYSEMHELYEGTSYIVNYTNAQRARICCHNTDLVHVNGHDRIILVIFSQALYKAPWWWILCDPKHVGALLNILYLTVSTYYILCISWIIKCLIIFDARCKHEECWKTSLYSSKSRNVLIITATCCITHLINALSTFRNIIAYWKVHRLLPFIFLVRATCR